MPRFFDRDRRPEEGWDSGSRATRNSGWEPVRMAADDRDWADDWDEGDRRDRDDDRMYDDRQMGTSAGESRWGSGPRRSFFTGRDRRDDRGRGPGGPRPEPRGARDHGRHDPMREADDSRWAAGPYTGVGPRGYRRSDDRIREDVSELLARHGRLDASDIDVAVADGEVTLSGSVDSRWAKREAEDVADEASGVHDVHNRLRVRDERRGQDRMVGSRATMMTTERATTARPAAGLREGMTVIDSEGDGLGDVKEIRDRDFLLDRSMQRDIYVPMDLIASTSGEVAYLSRTGDELGSMGLEEPPLTGGDGDTEATTSS